MTQPLVAKAEDIIQHARAVKTVNKARRLDAAFDAECRAAERPVGFWQWAGYTAGLRTRWTLLVGLATILWVFVLIAPHLWLLVKGLAFLLPIWFFTALFGPRRRYRRSYYDYR